MNLEGKEKLVRQLEENFDIHEWNYDGIPIYQFFRFAIHDFKTGKSGNPEKYKLIKGIITFVRLWNLKSVRGEADNNVFIGPSSLRKALPNGKSYADLFLPYYKNSSKALFLETTSKKSAALQDYYGNKVFNLSQSILWLFLVYKSRFAEKKLVYPEKKVVDFLKQNNYDADVLELFNRRTIRRYIAFYESSYFLGKLLFRKLKPAKVYFVCSYCKSNIGFIAAANDSLIETLEVQHGVIGENHYGYGKWTQPPKQRFPYSPSSILLWDSVGMENMKSFNEHVDIVNLKVTGHPLASEDETLSELHDIDLSKHHRREKPSILVSLQPIEPLLPEFFISFVNKESTNFNWYFRLHPTHSNSSIVKDELVKKFPNVTLNLDFATKTPLFLMLSEIDVHITQWSSIVLEASYKNISSLVLDQKGVNLFSKNKNVFYCQNTKQLSDNLANYLLPQQNFNL